jgi:3-oxoacyl-[acyl-carrier-protein] synthase II
MYAGERVYVLDYDVISPLGIGRSEVFASLARNCGMGRTIESFCPDALPVTYAAEVRSSLIHWYEHEADVVLDAARYDRKFELALSIYSLMEERIRRLTERASPERTGIILGLGVDVPPIDALRERIEGVLGDTEEAFADAVRVINSRQSRINTVLNPYDLSSVFIAEKLGLDGFQKTVITACTASTQAIAQGYSSLARGEMDVVVVGGSDSIINRLALISFSRLGVLACDAEPSKACRPFDVARSGTLAGEAAGLCVLATETFVRSNRLEPMFEFLGYGNTLDAYNITAPDPLGTGMKRAFAAAFASAGVTAGEIDYVNLHGTGTRSNDAVEIEAVASAFGACAAEIPMSSTKDRHGHGIAGAGIQELAVACLCAEHDFVPCTLNLERPIRASSPVDLVMRDNRRTSVKTVMTVNFAFGGVNTALLLRRQ